MGVSQRILLHGPPGTGKTYAATRRALPEDAVVYSITMTEETPMAEIRGHFVQKDGSFVWMDGPAVRSWREGARLVINEIDRAGDDVLSFLYAIMDDPEFAAVTLPTGETISPIEGFQLVATMNGEPEDLPDALQDRLPVTIEITDLNPEALARLPEDLKEPAKNTTLLSNSARRLSIRAWLEFASLRDKLDESMGADGLEIAATAIFGDRGHEAILALNVASEASEEFTMGIAPEDEMHAFYQVIGLITQRAKEEGLTTHTADNDDEWDDIASEIRAEFRTAFVYDVRIRISHEGPDSPPVFRRADGPNDESGTWHNADGTKLY